MHTRTINNSAMIAALALFGPTIEAPPPRRLIEPGCRPKLGGGEAFDDAFLTAAFAQSQDSRFAQGCRLAEMVDHAYPISRMQLADDEADEEDDDDIFSADDDDDDLDLDDDDDEDEADDEAAEDEEDEEPEMMSAVEYTLTATMDRRTLRRLQASMHN